MGIAPTGSHMTASAVLIIRVEEGKIAEDWLHLDGFAMLQHYGGPQAQLSAAGM
jgi:predicted ester cyclase